MQSFNRSHVQTSPRSARPASPAVPGTQPPLDSHLILSGRSRVAIKHGGETYWLHETRQGKLLLTK